MPSYLQYSACVNSFRKKTIRQRLSAEKNDVLTTSLRINNILTCLAYGSSFPIRCFLYLLGTFINIDKKVSRIEHCFIANLPNSDEINEIRILHLSDLHLDVGGFDFGELNNEIKKECFDFAVITGDFVDTNRNCLEQKIKELSKTILNTQSTDIPILATLGNHDSVLDIPTLESTGIKVLLNQSCTIKCNDSTILVLTGIDDTSKYQNEYQFLSVKQADTFKIILSHSPNVAKYFEEAKYNLMLCGHTHGGQISICGYSIYHFSRSLPHSLIKGRWKYKNMEGFTNQGVGCSLFPIRLGTAPEYAIITLKRAN